MPGNFCVKNSRTLYRDILHQVLKLIGLGFWAYFSDGSNQFDAFIVAASLAELTYEMAAEYQSGGGFSLLRGLRVLRLLKLVRSWRCVACDLMHAYMHACHVYTHTHTHSLTHTHTHTHTHKHTNTNTY